MIRTTDSLGLQAAMLLDETFAAADSERLELKQQAHLAREAQRVGIAMHVEEIAGLQDQLQNSNAAANRLWQEATAARAALQGSATEIFSSLRALRGDLNSVQDEAKLHHTAHTSGLDSLMHTFGELVMRTHLERSDAAAELAHKEAERTAVAVQAREANDALRSRISQASSDFDSHRAKAAELRDQILELDNEKCEQSQRAESMQRECQALRIDNAAVREWAVLQASKIGAMMDTLEARERQCNADFDTIRRGKDKLEEREMEFLLEAQRRRELQQASAPTAPGKQHTATERRTSKPGSRERISVGGGGGGGRRRGSRHGE